MKNLSKIALLFVISQVCLTSCKKLTVEKDEALFETKAAKSVKEIKASANFNWNTANTIKFNFVGIPGDARKSTLTILAEDNSVLLKKLQNASESYSGTVEIPAHTSKISFVYLGNKTELKATSSTVNIEVK